MDTSVYTLSCKTTPGTLYLTQKARDRLHELLSKEDHKHFRIMVDSGGCSGFQYRFNLDDQTLEDDLIFEVDDLKVVTDGVSLPFLEGITIDFTQDLMGSAFALKNPNAAHSCGCGNSFSI